MAKWRHWTVIGMAVGIGLGAGHSQRAEAQSLFGQVSTARPLDRGTQDIGGFLGVFENSTGFFGQYRRGLFSQGDGGLQFGVVDPDGGGDVGVGFGGDLKFTVMSAASRDPFDLGLGPRVGFFSYGGATLLQLGGSVVISRDYTVSNGGYLSPYGAVNMRMESVSNGASETEFQIGAQAGLKWEITDLIDVLGEVVLDDELGIIIGLNFKL
ncbi:MAG: hypothetical protein AB1792_03050 [Candidatus Zixiibacteriota bacterium]